MNIHESVDHILSSDELLGNDFYEVFFDRYPEVQEYFQGVDLIHQSALLTMALMIVEQFSNRDFPAMARYLTELGAKHCRRGIPPELYPCFREAMLETLQRHHGSDWNADLARQWAAAIDGAIVEMLKGYQGDSQGERTPTPIVE